MGLLTSVLKNPVHSMILGAIVGGAALYLYLNYIEAGKDYAKSLGSDLPYQQYLQAAVAGAAVSLGITYVFFQKGSGAPAAGPESAPLLSNTDNNLAASPEALGQQTMLTEPFE